MLELRSAQGGVEACSKMNKSVISIVIPTYGRSSVLIDTISQLLVQNLRPEQIVVVDQTTYEEGSQEAELLSSYSSRGLIKWVRQQEASIPKAMNRGLMESTGRYVLFLDDDVLLDETFISNHQKVIDEIAPLAYVGQIVQPWESSNVSSERLEYDFNIDLEADLYFRFNSNAPTYIQNCMAGNLCVDRESAILARGFDENFSKVAYRFETEFCKRFCVEHNTLFYYAPSAMLHHLYVRSGGTRAHSSFLTSASSDHSFGDYYYALLHGRGHKKYAYIVRRFISSVKAKFYLRKPWYIPIRLLAETRGILKALECMKSGQQLLARPAEQN